MGLFFVIQTADSLLTPGWEVICEHTMRGYPVKGKFFKADPWLERPALNPHPSNALTGLPVAGIVVLSRT
jgi:hypothetical protein